ncbi:cytochrome P450, partial [Thelonectria olida]
FIYDKTDRFVHKIANNPSLGHSPARIWASFGRYTYSGFASQIFGMEVPESEDPVIEYIHGALTNVATLPGMFIVDTITALDHLPLFLKPWERDVRGRFQTDLEWCIEKLDASARLTATLGALKKQKPLEDSIFRTGFLRMVLNDQKHMGFQTVEEAAFMCLHILSQMSAWSLLEATMMFPDVQKKAQPRRQRSPPVFSDVEMIPYVRYLMKEVWRWRPPVSLGLPHTTTPDLEYGGYRIPKGSSLHLSAWAIDHDPHRHEDSERFWPERYMHDKTTAMQSRNFSDVSMRDHFAFGSGRRICKYIVVQGGLVLHCQTYLCLN